MKTIGNEPLLIGLSILAVIVVILSAILLYLLVARHPKYVLKKAKDEAKKIKMQAVAEAKVTSSELKNEMLTEMNIKKQEFEKELEIFAFKRKKFKEDLEILNNKEIKNFELEAKNKRIKDKLSIKMNELLGLLENVSNMSIDQAKEKLIEYSEKTYLDELNKELKQKEEKIKSEAQEVVNQILVNAMEKSHVQITNEKNTSIFIIEDESLKGKIIGREGRNVKAFQQYGGVDIIIDDIPNRILISSFNPIRREIAYNTLKVLLDSGRIQPAAIEETLILEEEKIQETFKRTGLETVKNLDLYDLPDEIVENLGKLKCRYSYGQNVLQHSIEVAKISASIARELNMDEKIALKAGLLHDIGKAMDFEQDGSHIQLGVLLLRKYKIDEIIVNAVEAHHNDVAKKTIYAEIVAIADASSAARPGARNNNSEEFYLRMKEIENDCNAIKGVEKTYVLQSGRNIRVIVNPLEINEYDLKDVLYKIKSTIAEKNCTPGEIKITVIYEKRESTTI
ncbi:HDIG domain-containing metalloprotein [Spiroplasma culicicola]|uniref:Ribonuclease Y n=1 Tax=Spiroplasma culicicola AES-1 TaxID=1276246 RepID=W6A721_9MOLU|nr:HDIG domain-containing metalloprotein [Spiroplasma culicicola]AHI52670.1 hypothetical protein SCULI_v1c03290 [Spiroplasma culicicola AES-1]